LYLASTADRTSAQDRAVTATKGDEVSAVQVESAALEGDEPDVPIEFVPIPPGLVFEQDVVYGEGAYVTAGAPEPQLIYSNTLGSFGAALGAGKLVADDITTVVPGGCTLVKYVFPVVGKVNPSGTGGQYTVDFAMYRSCPQSVPSGSRPGLIIPGTQGQLIISDQCQNNTDNDGDTVVNDGCPTVGPAESGAQCENAIDDDDDTKVNDGCPAVGDAETDVGSTPRFITFVAPPNILLETNMWFGVKFSRNNAGMMVGAPPMEGFSCDQWDYPGFPCDSDAGGFPEQPQASFNLEIFADPACANSYTGYKNDKPSGSLYNPGTAGVFLADDIQLSATGCNMIAYEVALRGQGFYEFRMQSTCGPGGIIAGTQQFWSQPSHPDVKIVRFTFETPIALPQNLSFQASVNNETGSVVIAGQQACIGSTGDLLFTIVNNTCVPVLPEALGPGIHGAFNLAITCAGAAPVGACCDMFITDENNDAVCREVPKTNCPFPDRSNPSARPVWVQVAPKCSNSGLACDDDADCSPDGICSRCDPDQFEPEACGVAACCKPDGSCANITQNECYAIEPLEAPRKWDLGRYCNADGQRCPRIACLARHGECTLPRCAFEAGNCDNDRYCQGGLNPGTICTSSPTTLCRVCANKSCTGNRVCSKKKCSGSPINTVCIGTGQGTCPTGQTCNFVNCTTDANCTAFTATCPGAVDVCTGTGQGTCPPNQTCSFTNCTADSGCKRVCTNKQCSGAPANTVCTGEGQGTCPGGQTCNYITCTLDSQCTATGGTCQPVLGACPAGGACGTAPNVCTAGLVGLPCTSHSDCPGSGVCNLTTNVCSCLFDSHCDCPGFISSPPPDGTLLCLVGPTCCDGCPPIGCEDPECCTDVCNQDVFCCNVEWDDTCAGDARTICDVQPANDVCSEEGRLEGARLLTDVPPDSGETDSGRATARSTDPGFGCFVGNPGAKGYQTVWYKFVASFESALLQTCLSNSPAPGHPLNDTLLAVFAVGDPTTDQTACTSLMPVACNDDFASCGSGGRNSKLCVQRLIPGNLYYVMVGSKNELTDGDAYRLDISAPCSVPPPPPLGDFCPDGQEIFDGTTAFNLLDATMTAPVESCIPTMYYDKWYKHTATCTGILTVETCGADPESTPDTNLAIYGSGENGECLCPPSSGDPIDCSADAQSEVPPYPNCGLGSKVVADVVEGDCYSIRLADNVENRPSGNLTIACVQADCPAGEITFVSAPPENEPTDPPNGVVAATRPHDPNSAASLLGIQVITAYGPGDALASCFTLCETTNGGPLNSIAGVLEGPSGTYTITLTKPITAGELTTITYTDTHGLKSSGRFTSSPGNVNADPSTSASDVDAFFEALNGTTALVWGRYSGDVNLSYDPILNPTDYITPADGLEVIDLINGGGAYIPWDGAPNQSENPACPPP